MSDNMDPDDVGTIEEDMDSGENHEDDEEY